jgi:hypothetical protein
MERDAAQGSLEEEEALEPGLSGQRGCLEKLWPAFLFTFVQPAELRSENEGDFPLTSISQACYLRPVQDGDVFRMHSK